MITALAFQFAARTDFVNAQHCCDFGRVRARVRLSKTSDVRGRVARGSPKGMTCAAPSSRKSKAGQIRANGRVRVRVYDCLSKILMRVVGQGMLYNHSMPIERVHSR